jgi:hypothetical protein
METFRFQYRLASIAGQATIGLLTAVALTIGAPTFAEARTTKYYLTPGIFQGDAALTACSPGFHMASLWEVRDPTNLQYDTIRGYTLADSGSGPPTERWGWIRTGNSSASYGGGGVSNCAAWTTNAGPPAYGTFAQLVGEWNLASSPISPWAANEISCDTALHVWCVSK